MIYVCIKLHLSKVSVAGDLPITLLDTTKHYQHHQEMKYSKVKMALISRSISHELFICSPTFPRRLELNCPAGVLCTIYGPYFCNSPSACIALNHTCM